MCFSGVNEHGLRSTPFTLPPVLRNCFSREQSFNGSLPLTLVSQTTNLVLLTCLLSPCGHVRTWFQWELFLSIDAVGPAIASAWQPVCTNQAGQGGRKNARLGRPKGTTGDVTEERVLKASEAVVSEGWVPRGVETELHRIQRLVFLGRTTGSRLQQVAAGNAPRHSWTNCTEELLWETKNRRWRGGQCGRQRTGETRILGKVLARRRRRPPPGPEEGRTR